MFAQRLKELRESHHYSMDSLCNLYNDKFDGKLNKSTLSRYENNLQEPMFNVVKNLADIFNVSVDYLTGADMMERSDEYAPVFRRAKREGISPNDIESAIDFIKAARLKDRNSDG